MGPKNVFSTNLISEICGSGYEKMLFKKAIGKKHRKKLKISRHTILVHTITPWNKG
jgi:hypothetical protein